MATAKVKTEKVTKTVTVDENFYVLTLSEDEARNLLDLLGNGVDYDTVWSNENNGMGLSTVYYALDRAGCSQGTDRIWSEKAVTEA